MGKHMTKAERDECLTLYGSGITIAALAIRYDRHRETIVKLVRRRQAHRGHKYRPRGPRKFLYYARTLY